MLFSFIVYNFLSKNTRIVLICNVNSFYYFCNMFFQMCTHTSIFFINLQTAICSWTGGEVFSKAAMVWLVHLDHAFYQMLVINWDIYAKSMRSHDCCLLVHSDSEVNNLTAIHNGHGNLMHLLGPSAQTICNLNQVAFSGK